MTAHTPPWWVPLLLAAGLSFLGSLYVNERRTTDANTQSVAQHISALEAHQTDRDNRLDRIETKLDKLVDSLLKP